MDPFSEARVEPGVAEIVRQVYEATSRGDLDAFFSLMASDVSVELLAPVPWGGVAHGIDEFREFVMKAGEYIRSSQSIEEVFDAGDEVVVIGRSRGTAVKTGREFDVRIVHVWRVVDGAIKKWQLLADVPVLLDAVDSG